MSAEGPSKSSAERAASPAQEVVLGSAFALLVLIAAVSDWTRIFSVETPTLGDLAVYRGAIQQAADGRSLYDYRDSAGIGFLYPPFAAVVMRPLLWFPKLLGDQLWSLSTILLCPVLSLSLLRRSRSKPPLWISPLTDVLLGTAILLLSSPLIHNLECGQISLWITLFAFLDVSGTLPKRWQGALVGIAAALKLTPLLFIAHYFLTRQWRQASVAIGTLLATTALGLLFYPQDSLRFWTRLSGQVPFSPMAHWGNLSLLGLFKRWDLGGNHQRLLCLFLCAVVAAVALLQARRHHHRGETVEASLVVGCASVAVAPLSWSHYQTWVVLAGIWLLLHRRPIVGAALLLVTFFLFFPVLRLLTPELTLGTRLAWELPTLASLVVALLGLPKSPLINEETLHTAPASKTTDRD